MGNTEKRVGLNRSQSEIALSEEVYPGSALNTISVTMFFEDYSAEKAAAACDRVFESSDVFKAALVKEGTGYCFYPDSRQILPCLISVKRTREQAEDYISGLNAQSMVFPRNLYHAEAFDLEEGGSALIVRFHHILTDGYGMSLFAQRVADALEGARFRGLFFSGMTENFPLTVLPGIPNSGGHIFRTIPPSPPFSVKRQRASEKRAFPFCSGMICRMRRDTYPKGAALPCRMCTRRLMPFICGEQRENPTLFSLWRGSTDRLPKWRRSAAIRRSFP